MQERLPKKFLCAREGTVGTAHQNRDGQTVDFYPVRGVKVRLTEIYPYDQGMDPKLRDATDEFFVRRALNGAELRVAGRGEADVIVQLPIGAAECGVDTKGNAFVRVVTGTKVVVEGHILTITEGDCARWPSRDQRAQRDAAAIERDRAIANAKGAETITPRQAAKITRVVFKHLENPDPYAHKAALDRFYSLLLGHFGIKRIEALPEWLHDREVTREHLLATRVKKTP